MQIEKWQGQLVLPGALLRSFLMCTIYGQHVIRSRLHIFIFPPRMRRGVYDSRCTLLDLTASLITLFTDKDLTLGPIGSTSHASWEVRWEYGG